MTSNNIMVLVVYMLSILCFFGSCNSFMFWIFLELNLVSFLYTMWSCSFFYLKSEDAKVGIFYFLIQSLGSVIFLFALIFDGTSISGLFFLLAMFFKMGIFPFHFWVYYLGACAKPLLMFFILSIQKLPLFMIIFSYFGDMLLYFIFFSFVSGSLFIFFSKSFVSVLISSSISTTFMVYMIFLDNIHLFYLFFFVYSSLLFILFFYLDSHYPLHFPPAELIMILLTFMFLVGLPPMSLFFFKFGVTGFMCLNLSSFQFLFFWLLSFLSALGYTNFFFSYFTMPKLLYMSNKLSPKYHYYFITGLLYSIFFLIY